MAPTLRASGMSLTEARPEVLATGPLLGVVRTLALACIARLLAVAGSRALRVPAGRR